MKKYLFLLLVFSAGNLFGQVPAYMHGPNEKGTYDAETLWRLQYTNSNSKSQAGYVSSVNNRGTTYFATDSNGVAYINNSRGHLGIIDSNATYTVYKSALLQMNSIRRGFLMPRMTQAQRNAITSPATGLQIYQTNNTPGFYYYNGSAWIIISSGSDIIPVSWGDTITGSPAHENEVVFFNNSGDIYSDTNFKYIAENSFYVYVTSDSCHNGMGINSSSVGIEAKTISGDSLASFFARNGNDLTEVVAGYSVKHSGNVEYVFNLPTDSGSVGQILSVASNDGNGNTALDWQTGIGGCEIYCDTFHITATQLLAGNTPKELIPSPGAGKFIEVVSASFYMNFGSAEYGTNTNVNLVFQGASEPIGEIVGILGATSDALTAFTFTTSNWPAAVNMQVNAPLQFQVPTGNPVDGDGTGVIYLHYRIVDL